MGNLAYPALVCKRLVTTKSALSALFRAGNNFELLVGRDLQKAHNAFLPVMFFHGVTNTVLSLFVIKLNLILVIGIIIMLAYSIYLWYSEDQKA